MHSSARGRSVSHRRSWLRAGAAGAGLLILWTAGAAIASGPAAKPASPRPRLQPPAAFLDFCAHQPAECEFEVEPAEPGGRLSEEAIRRVLFARYYWITDTGKALHQVPHGRGEPFVREITHAAAAVPSDGDAMKTVERINAQVNRRVRPVMDETLYGRDFWRLAMREEDGDCEDYALTKRKELIAAGIPSSALSLAIGLTERREAHAVLLVATDHGDLVLDNLSAQIVPPRQAPYLWRGRQAPGHSMIWVAVT